MTFHVFTTWILSAMSLILITSGEEKNKKGPFCVSHDHETNYFKFFKCQDHEYCCGIKPDQSCCPKLSIGAIVGIALTVVVFLGLTLCCVVSCCLWCDCCLYKRSRDKRRRASFRSIDLNNKFDETDKLQHRPTAQQLTLRIGVPPEDTLNRTSRIGGVILGPRASIDLQVPPSPLSPTTPMSIASPSEFSKLIAHDWNRQKHKEEISPYQETTETDIEQPNYHRSDLP